MLDNIQRQEPEGAQSVCPSVHKEERHHQYGSLELLPHALGGVVVCIVDLECYQRPQTISLQLLLVTRECSEVLAFIGKLSELKHRGPQAATKEVARPYRVGAANVDLSREIWVLRDQVLHLIKGSALVELLQRRMILPSEESEGLERPEFEIRQRRRFDGQ